MASLLQQLVQQKVTISSEITNLYQDHIEKETRPLRDEFATLFCSEICNFSKVFIIVDALDECSQHNGTRESILAKLVKSVHSSTSWLLQEMSHKVRTNLRMQCVLKFVLVMKTFKSI